jgi:hypothetical protein
MEKARGSRVQLNTRKNFPAGLSGERVPRSSKIPVLEARKLRPNTLSRD